MNVVFKTSEGREFTLEIWFFARVLEMKEMVEKYEGYPVSSQTMVFNGEVLKDDGSTELYDILQGSKIQLIVETDQESEITTEDGELTRVNLSINVAVSKKRFCLEADVMDNVGRIKERIQESEGIPMSRLALYLGTCELHENRVLADYGITDNSEVNVVVRPFPATHNIEKRKRR